jgi:hypothetical protein
MDLHIASNVSPWRRQASSDRSETSAWVGTTTTTVVRRRRGWRRNNTVVLVGSQSVRTTAVFQGISSADHVTATISSDLRRKSTAAEALLAILDTGEAVSSA